MRHPIDALNAFEDWLFGLPILLGLPILFAMIGVPLVAVLFVVGAFDGPSSHDGVWYQGGKACHYEYVLIGKTMYARAVCHVLPALSPVTTGVP